MKIDLKNMCETRKVHFDKLIVIKRKRKFSI
jgi:hypothetical protein